ncbi:MAG: hypothetical protein HN704_08275 [Bacteroidetes bacterium]|jgi:hypothetical protein|nr:hypothetical protein [Bacteroidota bacterium]MBT6686897.1 hypothetical protein [Bacteroidota bacterium]MBT7144205.1 hypothetical protein [Bacteroidota bacterium]MBT7491588.1 hypothetical protein [Bacteroidota bacterium]
MKNSFIYLTILLCILLVYNTQSQDLKINQLEETELSKASKKGRYAGTYLDDGKFKVLYLTSAKKEGIQLDQYHFDSYLKYSDMQDVFVDDAEATNDFVWYMPKEKVEEVAPNNQKFIKATAAFGGGMKIYLGKMIKVYYMGIFTGLNFVEEKKLKPKTGDIWRIRPSGYKTTSKIDAISTGNSFYRELDKYGNPLTAPANSPVLAAGIITEKIKTKGPWLTSGNQVAILAIDGKNFDDTRYNIYPLPYTAQTMGSGLGQDDNLSVLFAPLNGPTNVKSLKHFLWKDRKTHATLMRFSDNYELVDSVSFINKILWASFRILEGDESTYVIGLGKASFDGWARNADGIQLKKVEDIQVSRVKDGKVLYSKLFSEELIESKLIVPKGEKSKNVFGQPHLQHIREIISLPNGDSFIIAQSATGTYSLQLSSEGDLKAFYRIPRIDKKVEGIMYDYQLHMKGDNIYLVLNEQLYEHSNNAKVSHSSTKLANSAGTLKTTTVKKLNEVFLQSQIVRINTNTMEISNRLIMNGKEFFTMGSFPAIFTDNAIYFTGREKGPKGKKIYMAKIEL